MNGKYAYIIVLGALLAALGAYWILRSYPVRAGPVAIPVIPDRAAAAIAEYLSGPATPDADYDRYLLGDQSALSARARAGELLFFRLGCAYCHQGVNFGGNMSANLGVMEDYFASRNGKQNGQDMGRYDITGRAQDKHVYKVPALRNAELTAPYFHDGSIKTLDEAVRAMARYQVGIEIGDSETADIVAFIGSLTSRSPGRPKNDLAPSGGGSDQRAEPGALHSSRSPGRPKNDLAQSVAVAASAALRIRPTPGGYSGGGSDQRTEPGALHSSRSPGSSRGSPDPGAGTGAIPARRAPEPSP